MMASGRCVHGISGSHTASEYYRYAIWDFGVVGLLSAFDSDCSKLTVDRLRQIIYSGDSALTRIKCK